MGIEKIAAKICMIINKKTAGETLRQKRRI